MNPRELQQEILRLRAEQRANDIRLRRRQMDAAREKARESQRKQQELKCKEAQAQRQELEARKDTALEADYRRQQRIQCKYKEMRKQFEQTRALKDRAQLGEKHQEFQGYRFKLDEARLREQQRIREIRSKASAQRQNFERAKSRSGAVVQQRRQSAQRYERQVCGTLSKMYQDERQREARQELRELRANGRQ